MNLEKYNLLSESDDIAYIEERKGNEVKGPAIEDYRFENTGRKSEHEKRPTIRPGIN